MRLALATSLLAAFVSGCATNAVPGHDRIDTIVVQPFRCNDLVLSVAVQNVFIEALSRNSSARIVREGAADVVVEGTVTFVGGSTSKGSVGGAGTGDGFGVFGSNQSAAGDYVAGITALATTNGEVVGSASWGQPLGGGKLLAPEIVARVVANELVKALRRAGLERR